MINLKAKITNLIHQATLQQLIPIPMLRISQALVQVFIHQATWATFVYTSRKNIYSCFYENCFVLFIQHNFAACLMKPAHINNQTFFFSSDFYWLCQRQRAKHCRVFRRAFQSLHFHRIYRLNDQTGGCSSLVVKWFGRHSKLNLVQLGYWLVGAKVPHKPNNCQPKSTVLWHFWKKKKKKQEWK